MASDSSLSLQNKYEELMARTNVGIWEMDVENSIFSWDETCRKIYEFEQELYSCESQLWATHVFKEDQLIMSKNFEKVMSNDDIFDLKFRFVTPSQKVKYIHSRGYKFVKDGKIKLIGFHWEIDSSPVLSLTKMAADIAHEINNPLLIIQGKSMMLRRKISLKEYDFKTCENDLETIEQNCMRIEKVLKSVTALVEHSVTESMQKLSLNKIIREALDKIQSAFETMNLKISFETDKSIQDEPMVYVKFHEIVNVIIDLLNNSFDAVRDQKEGWTRIELFEINKNYSIKIIDSGEQISADIAKKMMDPFFTTKPTGRGIGLGLSVAKQVLRNHKGDLLYESKMKNTCFVILIPKA